MNDRDRLHKITEELNIPSGRWVLAGSGVMVLHGIERRMRDVDIFVATQTWFSLMWQRTERKIEDTSSEFATYEVKPTWEVFCTDPDDPKRRCDPPYLYRTMYDIEVNVFSSWRIRGVGDIDVAFWLHNVSMVDDIPCVDLQFILDWKKAVGRGKDVRDILLIENHFRNRGGAAHA